MYYLGFFNRLYYVDHFDYDVISSEVSFSASIVLHTFNNIIVCNSCLDMPFIIAPPTSVSIFYAVSLQQSGLGPKYGNGALMLAGAGLALCGIVPPLGRFFTRVR